MSGWLQGNELWLVWLAGLSGLGLVGAIVLVPMVVVRLPATYFAVARRRPSLPARHPLLRLLLEAAKGTLGLLLIIAGLLMLVLPGQGVLTILVGLTLVNFPGKFRLERYIVSRRPVLQSINWLRRRAGRPPLVL